MGAALVGRIVDGLEDMKAIVIPLITRLRDLNGTSHTDDLISNIMSIEIIYYHIELYYWRESHLTYMLILLYPSFFHGLQALFRCVHASL